MKTLGNEHRERIGRYKQARARWREQHSGLAFPTWQQSEPDQSKDFLEYCAWRLWREITHIKMTGNEQSQFNQDCLDWLLGFYIKLATSEDLKRVCDWSQGLAPQRRAHKRKYADGLLGILLRESDRMHPRRPADQAVFTGLLGGQTKKIRKDKMRDELRKAKADLRVFRGCKAGLDRLSDRIDPETRTALRENFERHERDCEQALNSPTSFTIGGPNGETSEVDFHSPLPGSDSQPRGRPKFDRAAENTYCELVRRFVKQVYRGRDVDRKTVAIIQHFTPGLLPDTYKVMAYDTDIPNKDELSSRLAKFMKSLDALNKKDPRRAYMDNLEVHFLKRSPFTALTALP
jgi:hypothetical protein